LTTRRKEVVIGMLPPLSTPPPPQLTSDRLATKPAVTIDRQRNAKPSFTRGSLEESAQVYPRILANEGQHRHWNVGGWQTAVAGDTTFRSCPAWQQ
jgi:CHASE2 domain-containing sensor protein